jgi:hypothetical protein
MVETRIEEVGEGHSLGMKYLFEMIGTPVKESSITKDSGATVSASADVLE